MENLLMLFLFSILVAVGVKVFNVIFSRFISTEVKEFSEKKKIELMLKMKEYHQENTGFPDVYYAKERLIIGRQFYTIFSLKTKQGLLKVIVLKQTFFTIPMYSIVYHLTLDDNILATIDTPTWDSIVSKLKE